MACDICGKNDSPLVDLLDSYKTREIKQICYGCETIVNRQNNKIMTMVLNIKTTLLVRFMSERRNSKARTDSALVEAS